MREYKFRAWDNYHQEMINWEQYKTELVSDDFVNHGKGPLTIMQYTGVKDINGKEIYEGDIVIVGKGEWICKVYYSNMRQAFMLKDLDIEYENSLNFMSQFNAYKIIGNVYEYPNLMKGRQ